ncbi:2-amino-4-hydroxy-6-hydroxymethyldihydropteridine diphosphokinase [Mucilaginibacter ginkgonis]|uniref:2-amino-4-hydroxy-6-hydroxymethyldihydropteridine pyrophosphokinase n=1 Tax=Mucilaginibacter ginkgonis TaxID=2682091 RepID=A0A6I4I2N1_9SPHI|nr:2-amino-4-hydroxy-6-hydroxymethyldihydropteridine diphosphokinase [Mucilaginibacter ginkgonis]QQL50715.1 2-amino-4-hydroxy-6-hydroxymethyldihydropteridine diphosphokinase [Mucilaginibacter ginkgonis]
MINVFLLLGSNLGDRQTYLSKAIDHIERDIAPVILKSSVYKTQSWGRSDQPDYLNQVIMLSTDKPAQKILADILAIEKALGRERLEKWGSRTIDIDILFYGDDIICEADLTVPHPHLHKRGFTLEPLAEIAPRLHHPVLNKTVTDLKNDLADTLNIKKL